MMKNSFILFFLTFCTLQSAVAQYTTETFSSAKLERKQKIGIYKPDNYSDKQAYPLLVVLNANSLMEPTISAVRYYERFQEMPPCIIVGVFDQRLEDVAIIDEVARPMNESARFFEFLATELVPYIQGKYPIAALKGLIASEEAAFFINYYMLSQKPSFNMIVSLNPIAIPRVGEQLSEALAAGFPQRLFYYMATADVENKLNYDTAVRFEGFLRATPAHESVEYHFANMKGTTVNAAKLQGIAQALDMCFDIYKPIGGKEYKTKMETLPTGVFEYLQDKYKTIETYFGVKKKPLVNDILATYTAAKSAADWDSLKKLSKYVDDTGYKDTAMPGFFMAEYYEKTSDPKKALKMYQKAYTKSEIDFITPDFINERITQLKGNAPSKKSKKEKEK